MSVDNVIETDVLVIGGGQAGCFAAIKAREQGVNVTLVDKGYAGKAGQTLNPEMFDVFFPERHNLDAWVKSGHAANEYLDNLDWVEITFRESLARWQDLASWGMKSYKWDKDGNVFISEAAKNDGEQIFDEKGLGTTGDGRAITPIIPKRFVPGHGMLVMRKQALKIGVKIVDRVTITDLIKQDGRIVGAIGIPADSNDTYIFKTKAVVLCAGTAGIKTPGIRTVTTTGDGDAMAYRIGCEITGKEWNDNHPQRGDFPAYPWTNIDRDHFTNKYKQSHDHGLPMYNAEGKRLESIRRKSGKKTTGQMFDGLAYSFEAHAGRAPLFAEVTSTGDFWPMNHSPKDYPRKEIDDAAMKLGRVRMTFGRALGQSFQLSDGIWSTGTDCATQVPGLYAAGDSLGVRPGYPMAGFAMAFCSVTGTRAGINAAEYAKKTPKAAIDKNELARIKKITYAPAERQGGFTPGWATQVIRNAMTPYWVLYVKKADRLQATLTTIEFMRDNVVPKLTARDSHELRLAHEVRSMILHCEMKLRASLYRKESRWTHYREDYPMRDDPAWLAWVKIKNDDGEMKLSKQPVPKKWWPDLSLPYEERYPMAFPGEPDLE
jgi:succinate dehydrogenase/fumarate reductase flavoprotein subunit